MDPLVKAAVVAALWQAGLPTRRSGLWRDLYREGHDPFGHEPQTRRRWRKVYGAVREALRYEVAEDAYHTRDGHETCGPECTACGGRR